MVYLSILCNKWSVVGWRLQYSVQGLIRHSIKLNNIASSYSQEMFMKSGKSANVWTVWFYSARKKVVVEIIDVALNAQLNSLSIAVCNQECILTDVKIKSK